MEPAPFIVDPETLGPLEMTEAGLRSAQADRLYPFQHGLIYMGYPERDQEMIAATMEEERDYQGLGIDVAARNLTYLKTNAGRAVDYINVFAPYVSGAEGRKPRALELGSGNGWFSFLLAEAGFDAWMCDFEANTLATGMNLQHENLGEGRRFVTDARFAPFETGSMDLVVFKAFVHHVEDYEPLFREANRVLRPGGTVAMMEPVQSLLKTVREMRDPDPHEGHHITWAKAYRQALRSAGFEIKRETPAYEPHGNTRALTSWLKGRATAAIDDEHPMGNWMTKLQLGLIGGAQMIFVAQKVKDIPREPRPPMVVIDPGAMVIDDEEVAAYAEFPAVLHEAAQRLS